MKKSFKMRRILLFFFVAVIATACSNAPNNVNARHNCSYKQDIKPINPNFDSGAIYLFGETHGTFEAPTFVADFACKVAQDSGEPIIVLLELTIPEVLSDLSTKPLSIEDTQNLILDGDSHWFDGHDGRTSAAMMDAILQILELREQGLDIALGSIYPSDETQSEYEDFISIYADEADLENWYFKEALQIKKFKSEFKNIVTLSGKVHTRNHLRFFDKIGLNETYMGFTFVSGEGTAWNCRPNKGGCKIHQTKTYRRDLVETSEDGSLVKFTGKEELFEGAFIFKSSTASLPYLNGAKE